MQSRGRTSVHRRAPMPDDYGKRWGEGAARCLMIDGDFDEDEGLRLMPIPDCFICPMTATVMEDPVMTVDGCSYERTYIERWFRQRQQERLKVTSPATNQDLPSLRLVSLTALRKAIEAYLAHRPELRDAHLASRSFEEAAQMLYGDLLEKQAVHNSVEDELSLLKDSNEVLLRAVQEAERCSTSLRCELEASRQQAQAFGEAFREEKASNEHLKERLRVLESSKLNSAIVSESSDHSSQPTSAVDSTGEVAKPSTSRCQVCSVCLVSESCGDEPYRLPSRDIHDNRSIAVSMTCRKDDFRPATVKLRGLLAFAVLLLLVVLARDPRQWDTLAEVAAFDGMMVRNLSLPSAEGQEKQRDEKRKKKNVEVDDVAIWSHVEHLRTGTPEERTHAALVLGIAAAANSENQAAIVRAGAVAPLVDLLQADAPETRGQAAVALRTLALGNMYNKAVIESSGAVPLLNRLLRDDRLEVQEVAAGALQALATAKSQVDIAQEGAIDSLVSLMQDDSAGIREEAAGALMILALNAADQVAMDAIPKLMELVMDEVPEVRNRAVATLQSVVDNLARVTVSNPMLFESASASL